MENIEKVVKEILAKNPGIKPKKTDKGWLFEVSAQGNPYEDFRDEYENADIVDDRIAQRALPNRLQNEQYLVVMNKRYPAEARLKEIHNKRFAEYSEDSLIIKQKEDVVDALMEIAGIKPESALRKTP